MTNLDCETGRWVAKNLFPPGKSPPNAEVFEQREVLYQTPIEDPILLGIVNGVGRAAPWKYGELLDALKSAAGGAPCHAFFVALHDNMVPEVRWVRRFDWDGWWNPFHAFELEPGAEQGGASYAGILSQQKDWLLLHEYNPGNELTITAFGTNGFIARLKHGLSHRVN